MSGLTFVVSGPGPVGPSDLIYQSWEIKHCHEEGFGTSGLCVVRARSIAFAIPGRSAGAGNAAGSAATYIFDRSSVTENVPARQKRTKPVPVPSPPNPPEDKGST